MNRLLNIYYSLLERLKYHYNEDIRLVFQLMQQDILRRYVVIQTDIRNFDDKTNKECLTFLVNLSFYFREMDHLFDVHYRILSESVESRILYN